MHDISHTLQHPDDFTLEKAEVNAHVTNMLRLAGEHSQDTLVGAQEIIAKIKLDEYDRDIRL